MNFQESSARRFTHTPVLLPSVLNKFEILRGERVRGELSFSIFRPPPQLGKAIEWEHGMDR